MIEEELRALSAPSRVVEAGRIIDKLHTAKLTPPGDIVQYVTEWVTRNQGNDRYGK